MKYKDIFSDQTLAKLNRQSADNLKKVLKGKTLMQSMHGAHGVLQQIIQIERPHLEELEILAQNILRGIYPIIEDNDITLDVQITDDVSINEIKLNKRVDFTVEYWYRYRGEKETDTITVKATDEKDAIKIAKKQAPKNSIPSSFSISKSLNESNDETTRRVINGITQGAALRNTFAFYMFKEHLDKIDPTLVDKYKALMDDVFGIYDDDNAIAMFLAAISTGQETGGGYSKVTINEIKLREPGNIIEKLKYHYGKFNAIFSKNIRKLYQLEDDFMTIVAQHVPSYSEYGLSWDADGYGDGIFEEDNFIRELEVLYVELEAEYNKINNLDDLNEDDSSSGGVTITARGVCFPILLHEMIKGLYELISLHGFKGDKEQNQQVVDKVDKLENEPEDLRYGKYIYDAINTLYINSDYDDPRMREYFLQEIYGLDNDVFFEFVDNLINEILDSKQKEWIARTFKEIFLDLRNDNIDNL